MGVAQLASQSANAAKASDDRSMVHIHKCVQHVCTPVNVDCVSTNVDTLRMADDKTTGQRLRALMDRAGMSVRAFAVASGYSHGSGVQRYIEADFEGYLKPDVASKMAKALAGRGTPPIDPSEVFDLIGVPPSNATPFKLEGAADISMIRDLPVYGTSLGAPREFDGRAIEQTMLNSGSVIEYRPRPVVLEGQRHAYGLYVQGSSMSPRFEDGEMVFASDSRHSRPPRIGDDVIVYVLDPEEIDDGESACAVLVKRLVRRTATYVELEQFNPACLFKIDAGLIRRIDRVYPWGELLS